MNNSNFQNYSNNNGTAVFTNLIEENQKELVKAYELQNTENFEESINCIERVARNFHFLGMMADQFAYTPELIQENRELLSQAHVNTIYDKFPKYEIMKNIHLRTNKKVKQHKVKWSEKEQKLFLEGIEKFGYKSKHNFIEQIRS